MKWTYMTQVVGRRHTGMHYTDDLEEAKRVSYDGVIWRKPSGEWELIPDA